MFYFLQEEPDENDNLAKLMEGDDDVNNGNRSTMDFDDDENNGNRSKIDSAVDFDDEKFGVILPPESQHVDDLLGEVRLWLRNHASKRIAWTTSILYGGHVAAKVGPDFAKREQSVGGCS